MGRKPDTGRYETRAELCKAVWEDYRASAPRDRNRTRRIAALNGCSMTSVNKILNTFEGMPPVEGEPERNHVLPESSLDIPMPPVKPPRVEEVEWVVQEFEVGWYTLMTFATEAEATAYYEGMVHAGYAHKIRIAEQTLVPIKVHAP